MALSKANQEASWIRQILQELGCPLTGKISLFEDNQSAISYIYNTKISSQSKHIGVRHAFIKDSLEKGDIEIIYKSTNENVADTLTKPLPTTKFAKHRQHMMNSAVNV
jgi:hypothetical protein